MLPRVTKFSCDENCRWCFALIALLSGLSVVPSRAATCNLLVRWCPRRAQNRSPKVTKKVVATDGHFKIYRGGAVRVLRNHIPGFRNSGRCGTAALLRSPQRAERTTPTCAFRGEDREPYFNSVYFLLFPACNAQYISVRQLFIRFVPGPLRLLPTGSSSREMPINNASCARKRPTTSSRTAGRVTRGIRVFSFANTSKLLCCLSEVELVFLHCVYCWWLGLAVALICAIFIYSARMHFVFCTPHCVGQSAFYPQFI